MDSRHSQQQIPGLVFLQSEGFSQSRDLILPAHLLSPATTFPV